MNIYNIPKSENSFFNLYDLISIIKDWQTLTTGIIAIFVAYFTVKAINRQSDLQQQQINDARAKSSTQEKRVERTARAALPGALSEIILYARVCAQCWQDRSATKPPCPPDVALNTIVASIRGVDDTSAESLISLVQFYQIHNSRIRSNFKEASESEAIQGAYDAIYLHAHSEIILPFSRGEVKSIEISEISLEKMTTALNLSLGILSYELEGFPKEVHKRIVKFHSPEETKDSG